jgi:hypothetical protein
LDGKRIADRDPVVPKSAQGDSKDGTTIKAETQEIHDSTSYPPDFIPQPSSVSKPRLVRARLEISEVSLKEGQEGTLAILQSIGEKDGKTTRTLKLQCQAAKE